MRQCEREARRRAQQLARALPGPAAHQCFQTDRPKRTIRAEPPHLGRLTPLEPTSDAELLNCLQTGAIEEELSAKTPQRQPAILYSLARRYEAIWYFCPKALEEPLRQSFAQLDESARRKCSLVRLPEERAAPPGQPATPPRPASGA